jgi:hypothetical protein
VTACRYPAPGSCTMILNVEPVRPPPGSYQSSGGRNGQCNRSEPRARFPWAKLRCDRTARTICVRRCGLFGGRFGRKPLDITRSLDVAIRRVPVDINSITRERRVAPGSALPRDLARPAAILGAMQMRISRGHCSIRSTHPTDHTQPCSPIFHARNRRRDISSEQRKCNTIRHLRLLSA